MSECVTVHSTRAAGHVGRSQRLRAATSKWRRSRTGNQHLSTLIDEQGCTAVMYINNAAFILAVQLPFHSHTSVSSTAPIFSDELLPRCICGARDDGYFIIVAPLSPAITNPFTPPALLRRFSTDLSS